MPIPDTADCSAKHCRVYIVAGFDKNKPYSDFQLWTEEGPYSQAYIERQDTFQGWATETLSRDVLVSGERPPALPGEFRVGLKDIAAGLGKPYLIVQTATGNTRVETTEEFVGWLTPTLKAELPVPTPRLLMRYRKKTDQGNLEGMFVATRDAVQAVQGRQAYFGYQFGATAPLTVLLEPQDFLQMTDDQSLVETLKQSADAEGTLCGLNPLRHLV